MMFNGFVGLTAIDVSLCGWFRSQSVFTFAPPATVDTGVVEQNGTPCVPFPPWPNTADVTGAGASRMLCVKSTGCGSSSAVAAATPRHSVATITNKAATPPRRPPGRRCWNFELTPFLLSSDSGRPRGPPVRYPMFYLAWPALSSRRSRAGGNPADRLGHFRAEPALEQEGRRPGGQCLPLRAVVAPAADHDHLLRRPRRAHLTRQLEPVRRGKQQIHEDDVGVACDVGHHARVARRGHDLDVVLERQQAVERVEEHLVIVDDDDPDRGRTLHPGIMTDLLRNRE